MGRQRAIGQSGESLQFDFLIVHFLAESFQKARQIPVSNYCWQIITIWFVQGSQMLSLNTLDVRCYPPSPTSLKQKNEKNRKKNCFVI